MAAEEQGFEPRDLLQSTVFKTVALNHSAILPMQRYGGKLDFSKVFFVFFKIKNQRFVTLYF
jgi:hypothetical protein